MTNPSVENRIVKLSEHAEVLANLEDMPRLHLEYEQWYTQVRELVADFLPTRLPDLISAYARVTHYLLEHPVVPGESSRILYRTSLQQQLGILLSTKSAVTDNPSRVDVQNAIEIIGFRFHDVARQLQVRHNNRQSIAIADEYDVQDLLHALFRLFFEDIRPEEWTPSYAGGSSRMDFLLKKEALVVEAKKTRKGLTEREIGEQFIIDIERYKSHPACKQLICFVYDPEDRLTNPKGLQNDLNRDTGGLVVKVLISPKRS